MSHPACHRCHDTGLVDRFRAIDDDRADSGRRLVLDVFRCACHAGEQVSARFKLDPTDREPESALDQATAPCRFCSGTGRARLGDLPCPGCAGYGHLPNPARPR